LCVFVAPLVLVLVLALVLVLVLVLVVIWCWWCWCCWCCGLAVSYLPGAAGAGSALVLLVHLNM
jgi:hypothetical protein